MSIKMPPKPKFSRKFLIYLLISVGLLVFLLLKDGPIMIEYILDSFITLIVIFDVLPLVVYLVLFIPKCMDYHLAKTNFPKYVKKQEELQRKQAEYNIQQQIEYKRKQNIIEQERQFAIASQQNDSPWAIKYCTHPCPHCGHYKVRYAKWEDKKASVAFWGIHSSKLAANYKCEHCGEMWE